MIGHTCEDEFWCDRCIPDISKLRNSLKIQLAGWDDGRRVVETSVLVDELNSGCRRCGSGPLLLSRSTILGEKKLGLGGYFYILCRHCRNINRIKYGKTHKTSKNNRGMPSFCVNTKLGAGMILEEIILLSFSVPFNYSRNSAPSLLCSKPGVYHSR